MPGQNITQERAATRYHHMQKLEQQLTLTNGQIADCKEHLQELKDRAEALIDRLRCAARDEGELPLFDLVDEGH